MKTHYSGGVVWEGGNRLKGWPVCCTAERAEKISEAGNQSIFRQVVNCKSCLKMLEKQDEFKAAHRDIWEIMRDKGYCL